MLVNLLHLRQVSLVALPEMCSHATSKKPLLSEGIFLASSPRQREADTGAKLKRDLLSSLVNLLDQQLTCMKQQLASLLGCGGHHTQAHMLPLAHGVVHT
jgi:hypothetical protein